jgi:hypothetical protein
MLPSKGEKMTAALRRLHPLSIGHPAVTLPRGRKRRNARTDAPNDGKFEKGTWVILEMGLQGRNPAQMMLLARVHWEVGAGVAAIAVVGAVGLWLVLRKRPTAEEIERQRREFLVQSGRIVDGMLLDVYEVDGADGRKAMLLLFNYRIGGVEYECSQDITTLAEVADAQHIRLGVPCSVRYQPGNLQNSIVIAERWSGLRAGQSAIEDLEESTPDHLS